MAYFAGSVRSKVLCMDTNVNVVIPRDYYDSHGNHGKCDKVLYLLHGLQQNADAWPRFSSAERFANCYGYALVFPEVQRSFYMDMAQGMKYYTFITEELPSIVHAMFCLPQERDNTYIGGLSMGGYGAIKCALSRPDVFAGAMCFSSAFYALKNAMRMTKSHYAPEELQGILGQELLLREEDDLDWLMKNFPADAPRPRLYLSCGTEDPLYYHTTQARKSLAENGFEFTYEEWAGLHDWRFWDVALERAMKLFAAS